SGGDDRAERRGHVGDGGDSGEPTAVGDREGREWEPGGERRGDVHPGGGQWDRDADDAGQHRGRWDRGADVVDPQPDGGDQHTHGDRERADREPSDVHGDRDGGGGGDDRAERRGDLGASGDGGEPTTGGDRDGRVREFGGEGGGDGFVDAGVRYDRRRQSDHRCECRGVVCA